MRRLNGAVRAADHTTRAARSRGPAPAREQAWPMRSARACARPALCYQPTVRRCDMRVLVSFRATFTSTLVDRGSAVGL